MHRSPLAALAILPLALVLAGCAPEPAPTPSATAVSEPTPTATPTPTLAAKPDPAPLAADVVMAFYATATADNGAVLDLTMTIHKATNWNDPAAADRPPVMTTTCAGYLDDSVYEGLLWSFTTVDVDATPRDGTPAWPGTRIWVAPSAGFVPEATTGFPVDDDEVDGATPRCKRDKYVDAAGTGTLVVGLPGDADEVTAAGNFTKWANHSWGVVSTRVAGQTGASAGVTLSDCEWTVTNLGKELGGDADWWDSTIDDGHCVFGNLAEQPEF